MTLFDGFRREGTEKRPDFQAQVTCLFELSLHSLSAMPIL